MITMLSAKKSASSRKWVVMIIVRRVRSAKRISQILRREIGSNPVLTSSTQQTLLPPANTIANCSFRFWPPESVEARAWILVWRSQLWTSSSIISSFLDSTHFSVLKMRRCSLTVNSGLRSVSVHISAGLDRLPDDIRLRSIAKASCRVNHDLPISDSCLPSYAIHSRGFAASIRPKQAENLPRIRIQVETFDGFNPLSLSEDSSEEAWPVPEGSQSSLPTISNNLQLTSLRVLSEPPTERFGRWRE